MFYGFGYCFCTDWHWAVRQRLGYPEMPRSYIKFLILAATGWNVNDMLVDAVTITAFLGVFALALYLALARKKEVHPRIPGNASRILKKKYSSSRNP